MTCRFWAALLVLITLVFLPVRPVAQTSPAKDRAAAWKQMRTPWGDPDLQGIWNNVTLTPLERPAEFKDKTHLTAGRGRWSRRVAGSPGRKPSRSPTTEQSVGQRTGYSPTVWFETGHSLSDRRTSLLLQTGRRAPAAAHARGTENRGEADAEREDRKSPADKPEDRGPYHAMHHPRPAGGQ